MNVFAVVKDNVTAKDVAMRYGIKINRSGLACCPFHRDKTPSMKIDKRYYCFGCGETGDATDLVAKYFGLAPKEAAMKIASDFGLNYDATNRPLPKPAVPQKSKEQILDEEQKKCFRELSDYYHLLKEWKIKYAPKSMDEELHPLFVEALQRKSYTEYLLDSFLDGSPEERRELVAQQGKEVMKLEQRIAEWTAAGTLHRGTGQKQPGTDRER